MTNHRASPRTRLTARLIPTIRVNLRPGTKNDPLKTLRGIRRYLPESENASPTAIQRATLLTALRGKDILAAAKTGSGKTLAFLIPLLEKLWTERWTNQDSTAAVVLSPTRELAMQTYDVLRTIAIRHDFSASLIIGGQTGGKNFKEEAGAIGRMNIIIATPGIFSKYFRLLYRSKQFFKRHSCVSNSADGAILAIL